MAWTQEGYENGVIGTDLIQSLVRGRLATADIEAELLKAEAAAEREGASEQGDLDGWDEYRAGLVTWIADRRGA